MPREPPTKEVWEQWRPTLIDWYKNRTADSIAEQLKNEHGLNVTAKMLRDRFRLWNAEPKYNRHQPVQPRRQRRKARVIVGDHAVEFTVSVDVHMHMQQGIFSEGTDEDMAVLCAAHENPQNVLNSMLRLSRPFSASGSVSISNNLTLAAGVNPLIAPRLCETPDPTQEDRHLQMTLKEVAGYLDRIVGERTWTRRHEEPTFELQKLVANAHMAISSQSYDCHYVWKELRLLYSPVRHVMPVLGEDNLLTLHPRALIVLLRLLVTSLSFGPWGSQTLDQVRYMFELVTKQTLQPEHPIRLLCSMPKQKTIEFLVRLLELMDVRLFGKICPRHSEGAIFVAQEQTYAARVLASLGYTQWAEVKLRSVIEDLDAHMDDFTKADAYRTLGYVYEQSCMGVVSEQTRPTLQDSKTASTSALTLFEDMAKGCSNEAMFTRISLAQVTRKLGEIAEAETHLTEAISIWQKIRNAEDQGGSKLILDLHQVLIDQRKFEEAQELRQQHKRYFEESRVYYEDQGS